MTLKEVYEKWAAIEANKSLALKYRAAANKCLLERHGSVDLEVFTDSFIETIFSTCKESKELKARAASLLQQILRWVREYRVDPSYAETAFEHDGLPKAQPENTPAVGGDKTGTVRMTSKVVRKRKPATVRQGKGGDARKGNRFTGRRPVLQLDPRTLAVVRRFDSASAANRELGISNISQFIRNRHVCHGHFWAYEKEFDENWKPACDTDGKPSPAATECHDDKASILSKFTDQQLIDELVRRQEMAVHQQQERLSQLKSIRL